jgi:E3 ubiquitin-protein ligase RNF217
MTCKEYQQGEKMLRSWAEQIDQNQHNAQKCPRCKVSLLFFLINKFKIIKTN